MGGQVLEYEAKEILNQGRAEGFEKGENALSALYKLLVENDRQDDAQRIMIDPEYRKEMYAEFAINLG